MRNALRLLQLATQHMPPPKGAHSLTLGEDGKLHLNVRLPVEDAWQDVILDDADLVMQPEALMRAIMDMLRERFGTR